MLPFEVAPCRYYKYADKYVIIKDISTVLISEARGVDLKNTILFNVFFKTANCISLDKPCAWMQGARILSCRETIIYFFGTDNA